MGRGTIGRGWGQSEGRKGLGWRPSIAGSCTAWSRLGNKEASICWPNTVCSNLLSKHTEPRIPVAAVRQRSTHGDVRGLIGMQLVSINS